MLGFLQDVIIHDIAEVVENTLSISLCCKVSEQVCPRYRNINLFELVKKYLYLKKANLIKIDLDQRVDHKRGARV